MSTPTSPTRQGPSSPARRTSPASRTLPASRTSPARRGANDHSPCRQLDLLSPTVATTRQASVHSLAISATPSPRKQRQETRHQNTDDAEAVSLKQNMDVAICSTMEFTSLSSCDKGMFKECQAEKVVKQPAKSIMPPPSRPNKRRLIYDSKSSASHSSGWSILDLTLTTRPIPNLSPFCLPRPKSARSCASSDVAPIGRPQSVLSGVGSDLIQSHSDLSSGRSGMSSGFSHSIVGGIRRTMSANSSISQRAVETPPGAADAFQVVMPVKPVRMHAEAFGLGSALAFDLCGPLTHRPLARFVRRGMHQPLARHAASPLTE